MKKRFRITSAVYCILRDGNKVLLQKRENTGFEDGNYGLPSGHLEENETAIEALVRETEEEIGVIIKEEDLEFVHLNHYLYKNNSDEDDYLQIIFVTDKWEGEIVNREPHKCTDLSWFDLDNLPENTIDYIQIALEALKTQEKYSETVK